MATTASIKVEKTFTYKDVARVWSNRYHFTGGAPADPAHWTTLSDAVTAAEKLILPSQVSITETIGYDAGSDVPIFVKSYALAGTASMGTGVKMPGDVAAVVRYSTDATSIKNHPVYLFNYYHAAYASGGDVDKPVSGWVTLLDTYAGAWITGFSDGTATHKRAGPRGAVALGHQVLTYLSHRDFPK